MPIRRECRVVGYIASNRQPLTPVVRSWLEDGTVPIRVGMWCLTTLSSRLRATHY